MQKEERKAALSGLVRDPRALVPAVLVIAGALGAGSYMGLTIEPEHATELRVDNATLLERTANLEETVNGLELNLSAYQSSLSDCMDRTDKDR